MAVYSGLEERVYDGTGASQSNPSSNSLAGRMIGELSSAGGAQFFLTDGLGRIFSTFNAVTGVTTILGNQVYGPYGNARYTSGSMGIAKGFTGQYTDSVSGLDYYNARYYDPVLRVLKKEIKKCLLSLKSARYQTATTDCRYPSGSDLAGTRQWNRGPIPIPLIIEELSDMAHKLSTKEERNSYGSRGAY